MIFSRKSTQMLSATDLLARPQMRPHKRHLPKTASYPETYQRYCHGKPIRIL